MCHPNSRRICLKEASLLYILSIRSTQVQDKLIPAPIPGFQIPTDRVGQSVESDLQSEKLKS